MIVLSALATIEPAGLGPQADPLNTPAEIQPEWYFFATFHWLKLFSITYAVLSMGLIVFVMVMWPWIDAAIRRFTPWKERSVWIGTVVALGIIALTLWEAIAPH